MQNNATNNITAFVFTFNDRAQIERTTWGTKDVRNPDAGSIKELVDQMGSDHQKFSDASIAKTSNLGDGALDIAEIGDSVYSEESKEKRPTDVSPQEKKAKEEAEQQKREEAKAKAVARKANKVFEAAAKRSVLDPEFQQLGTQLVEDARKQLAECKSLLTEIEQSPYGDTRKLYIEAYNTLNFRTLCLKKACSFEGADCITLMLTLKSKLSSSSGSKVMISNNGLLKASLSRLLPRRSSSACPRCCIFSAFTPSIATTTSRMSRKRKRAWSRTSRNA